MPNVKSAIKRVKTNAKARLRNRANRSALRTAIRRVDESIAEDGAEVIGQKAQQAMSVIGKTASKGVIHRKKAARLQSRIQKRVNQALAQKSE